MASQATAGSEQLRGPNPELPHTNSGVGLSLSVKEVICANSLDVLEINRYNFIAEWRGAARSARAAEAIDVICNHLDKPSGFGYYTGLFAV